MVIASLIGGIYSLIVLVNLSMVEFMAIKILMLLSLSFILFGYTSVAVFIKDTACFFGVNALFAGVMYGLYYFAKPNNMVMTNMVVYFNISASILAVYTVLTYGIITGVSYFYDKNVPTDKTSIIRITCDDKTVSVNAFYDTGNTLTDVFTGLPIIVCEYESIKELFPENIQDFFKNMDEVITSDILRFNKKVRPIPTSTINGDRTLPAFSPDSIVIVNDKKTIKVNAIVAVVNTSLSGGEYTALMSSHFC